MDDTQMAPHVVAVVATLDTKRPEASFLADAMAAWGFTPEVLDVGIIGARAGLRRNEAMTRGGMEAGRILEDLHRRRALAGVIGIGGNQGTAAAAIAMRDLPIGIPKMLVSTIVSGNLRPYIGAGDIVMVPSVGDLLGGTNRLTREVLSRAAAMMAAMIRPRPVPTGPRTAAPVDDDRPAVALTTLGNVEPAARGVVHGLAGAGVEVIPFHASGAGGSAMERLVEAGMFTAVVDLATHELLGEVVGADIYAPARPGRLTAAGRAGLPQVLAPGGLDYLVFGPPETVPAAYRGRPTHQHNPYNTNVRSSPDELRRTGTEMARRLRDAAGPAVFLDPVRGWSQIGRRGGPLWDAGANEAFRAALRDGLRETHVHYIELDAEINDAPVVDQIVTQVRTWLGR